MKSQVEELKRQLEKKDAELNDLKEETSMTSTSTIEKNNDDNPATASIIIAKDHEIEKLQSELNQLASAVKELKTEASETKGMYYVYFIMMDPFPDTFIIMIDAIIFNSPKAFGEFIGSLFQFWTRIFPLLDTGLPLLSCLVFLIFPFLKIFLTTSAWPS